MSGRTGAPPPSDSGRERRRAPRIDIRGQLQGHIVTRDRPILVRDIGLGGFGIETTFPVSVGDVHVIQLALADGSVVIVDATAVDCQLQVVDGARVYVTDLEFVDDSESGSTAASLIDKITSVISFDVN